MRDIRKLEKECGRQDPLTFNFAAMPAPGSEQAKEEAKANSLLSCVRA